MATAESNPLHLHGALPRFDLIEPGHVGPGIHELLAELVVLLDELESKEAFGRGAEPWEVANVMVFLASDYASYMTGEVVSVSSQRA